MLKTFWGLRFAIFCAGFLAVSGGRAETPGMLSVSSPDGKLSLSFALKSNPQPYLPGERAYYQVSYEGQPVMRDSPLGLDFLGAPALDNGFEVLGVSRLSHDETWENNFGTERQVRDHYNQLTVSLRERSAPGRQVDFIFRAYNEGVAFRYFIPKQEALGNFTISSENTGFYFAQPAFAYALNLASYTSSFESEYHRLPLDQIKPVSLVPLPLLVEIPGGPWVAILEADLNDYAGMYLRGVPATPNALISKLSPLPNHADEAVIGSAPTATPWRVLLVSPGPAGLIESTSLIPTLNPPCALADTSWIEPGKAAWDWWSGSYASSVDFKPGMNTPTMEHYIDFAAHHHLEYMLIDAGWSPRDDITRWVPQVDLPAIIAHAKQLGVKVILWMYWTAVKKQIDQAFPLYEKWGVSGIKMDFMNRNDQEMVNFYHEVAQKAAAHHLVVDFHGAFEPTGFERTYPNNLTREGVMGMEYNKWSDHVTPEHTVMLPFTRMLAGPADFTPGAFINAAQGQFQARNLQPMSQGTRAHQLAMYVDYFSPLAMVSDYPESYDNKPGVEFLEKVPTVWDETKALNGEPGKYVTVARRHGADWYLGSMTNWDARDLEFPLTFLGPGNFDAEIFADGPDADKDATSLKITRRGVRSSDSLSVHLAPGGGVAVIFTLGDP